MDRTLPKDDAQDKLPEREGVSTFATESTKHGAPLSRGPRPLAEMAGAYRLFNPGLIYTVGLVDRDPIADYWIRSDLPMADRPIIHELDYAPFKGIVRNDLASDTDWDRTVMLVKNEHASGLFDYLRALSFIDWTRRRFWRTEPADASIDEERAHRSPGSSGVPVTVFQVFRDDASFVLIRSAVDGRYHAVRWPAARSVALFADSLFAEDETPFRVIEPKHLGDPQPIQIPKDMLELPAEEDYA